MEEDYPNHYKFCLVLKAENLLEEDTKHGI